MLPAGAKFHGMVSGVTAKGVFITFYSGLSGLAPPSELGLTQQQQPSEVYKLGMVRQRASMPIHAYRLASQQGRWPWHHACPARPMSAETSCSVPYYIRETLQTILLYMSFGH